MKIEVAGFSGMKPGTASAYLDASNATVARDCRLYSGELRPMREPESVEGLAKTGTIRTIYPYLGEYWFHWTDDVSVVKNPTPGDSYERVFWTGDGIPKATELGLATSGGEQYPTGSRHLGVPAPESAPSLSVVDSGDAVDEETRFYVYTFVTDWGWESAPSPPSAGLDIGVGGQVEVSGFSAAPSGEYDWAYIRLYRISTGVDASAFLFCQELPIGTTTYLDDIPNDQLREVLETEGWLPPPDEMQGLCALASGALCGYEGHTLYFSPRGVPYAYPREWSVGTEHDIVGLATYENNVVVCTEGHPYLATGVDPSAMMLTKLEIDQACVSARSIVSVGAMGVLYASPDGLVSVGGEVDIISSEFMTREEWQAYNPSSIVGVSHDRAYIGFFEKEDGERGALVFSPESGFLELSITATAAYSDLSTDRVYFVDGDGDVFEMDAGELMPYRWKSKVFVTPPTSFSVARVPGAYDGGTVTLKVYGDGLLEYTKEVTDAEPFRLPAFGGARRWQLELEGTAAVEGLIAATSVAELGT